VATGTCDICAAARAAGESAYCNTDASRLAVQVVQAVRDLNDRDMKQDLQAAVDHIHVRLLNRAWMQHVSKVAFINFQLFLSTKFVGIHELMA
jgi:hypothetical protein